MDDQQTNNLKAYGIAFLSIENEINVKWLLNYKGGSFLIKSNNFIENECKTRNVSYSLIADIQSNKILSELDAIRTGKKEDKYDWVYKVYLGSL